MYSTVQSRNGAGAESGIWSCSGLLATRAQAPEFRTSTRETELLHIYRPVRFHREQKNDYVSRTSSYLTAFILD